jgi:DNA-binding sugar fermentation-stimulating protein
LNFDNQPEMPNQIVNDFLKKKNAKDLQKRFYILESHWKLERKEWDPNGKTQSEREVKVEVFAYKMPRLV